MRTWVINGGQGADQALPIFIEQDLDHTVIWPEDEVTEPTTQPIIGPMRTRPMRLHRWPNWMRQWWMARNEKRSLR